MLSVGGAGRNHCAKAAVWAASAREATHRASKTLDALQVATPSKALHNYTAQFQVQACTRAAVSTQTDPEALPASELSQGKAE